MAMDVSGFVLSDADGEILLDGLSGIWILPLT